jgi:hypothetical protein
MMQQAAENHRLALRVLVSLSSPKTVNTVDREALIARAQDEIEKSWSLRLLAVTVLHRSLLRLSRFKVSRHQHAC